jgi:hypothetical protein
MLELVCQSPVELLSIRSGGEIEDAFLKRLEADRMKGFNRAFDPQSSSNSEGMGPMMTAPDQILPEERVNGALGVAEEQQI